MSECNKSLTKSISGIEFEKTDTGYFGVLKQKDFTSAMAEEGITEADLKKFNVAQKKVFGDGLQLLLPKVLDSGKPYELKMPMAQGQSIRMSINPSATVRKPGTDETVEKYGQVRLHMKTVKSTVFDKEVLAQIEDACIKKFGA